MQVQGIALTKGQIIQDWSGWMFEVVYVGQAHVQLRGVRLGNLSWWTQKELNEAFSG